jgi:eukaryotic translation initiation factor 2C
MPPRAEPPETGRGRGERGGGGGGGERAGGRGFRGSDRGFGGGAIPAGGPALAVGHMGHSPPLPAAHVEAIGVRRPGYGHAGMPIRPYSNHVVVELTQGMIYHYDGTSSSCSPSLESCN